MCFKSSLIIGAYDSRSFRKHALKSLQNDPNANAVAISVPNSLLALGEGRVSSDEEEHVTLLPLVALHLDVQNVCNANFTHVESNYRVDD